MSPGRVTSYCVRAALAIKRRLRRMRRSRLALLTSRSGEYTSSPFACRIDSEYAKFAGQRSTTLHPARASAITSSAAYFAAPSLGSGVQTITFGLLPIAQSFCISALSPTNVIGSISHDAAQEVRPQFPEEQAAPEIRQFYLREAQRVPRPPCEKAGGPLRFPISQWDAAQLPHHMSRLL